jgi:dTDP-4-amino-4,6-dideoxygalactose transaminase
MPVPLLDLSRIHAPLLAQMSQAAAGVIADGRYILGPNVAAFEKEAAEWLGAPHAVGVSNGTDALSAAFRALALTRGTGRVATTPFTFIATAETVATAGFTPVFVDVDCETGLIDLDLLASIPDLVGVVPVHLFGQCVDMDRLMALASERGWWVVEDAAQSFGARWGNRMSGTIGTAGCYSFFPSKNLGGVGDGGLVTTSDPELAALVRSARAHGSSGRKYHHDFLSGNLRLDEIQAAILRVKLPCVAAWNEERRAVAARYGRLFEERGLLASGQIRPLSCNGDHVFHQYVVRADDRDRLAAHLQKHGVGHAVYYPVPLHTMKPFHYLGYQPDDLPVSMLLSRQTLALPVFPGLTGAEQEEVVGRIAGFYSGDAA